MEYLEQRILRAITPVVTIDTTGSQVHIVGDAHINRVRIERNLDTAGDQTNVVEVKSVSGHDKFLVNGVLVASYKLSDQDMTKRWNVDLGRGTDSLSLSNGLPMAVSALMGEGNDSFVAGCQISGVSVDGGAGDDSIYFLARSNIGSLSVMPGAGRDRVIFDGTGAGRPIDRIYVKNKLQVLDTQGPLTFEATALDVGKDAAIITGNSVDRITLTHCSFGRSLVIGTHGGNDVLRNNGSHFRGTILVADGSGDDQIFGF